jgi:uncharacterized protein YbjT (DUF2867 family)
MILVTGATGQIGQRLVGLLAESGDKVRALVQPGEQPTWSVELGVEEFRADFDDAVGLAEATRGAQRLFMLVPPHARQEVWQHNIVAAAKAARVDHVVKLSAFDTSARSGLTMGRWHHSGEQALARSGVPYTILRPQYFVQNLLSSPSIVTDGILPTFLDPSATVGAIDAHDVAAVAAALLVAADPQLYETVQVPTGPAAVTVADVAAELSRALQRVVTVDYLDPDAGRAVMRARGLPDWHIEDVLYICATASALVTDCVPRLTGRPARDIAAVADEFAATARKRTHADHP